MPGFDCPHCNDSFSSQNKLDTHLQLEHENVEEQGSSAIDHVKELVTDPKKLLTGSGTIFGIFLMIVLPLGTGIFYANNSGASPTSGDNSGSGDYTNKPPVGYNIQRIPNVDNERLPTSYRSSKQLADDVQVYLLYRGGPQTLNSRGLRPAVLLQYSCTSCPDIVSQLESIAKEFNQEGRWVYVAPYRDMNDTIAVSAFRNVQYLDKAEQQQISTFVCDSLGGRPLACAADDLFGSSNESNSNSSSGSSGENTSR